MPEAGRQDDQDTRAQETVRRSNRLTEDARHLHDQMLDTAEHLLRSHEQTAAMMENLADTGSPEYAARRHLAAERSRKFAEDEARHIAALKQGDVERADQTAAEDQSKPTDPS